MVVTSPKQSALRYFHRTILGNLALIRLITSASNKSLPLSMWISSTSRKCLLKMTTPSLPGAITNTQTNEISESMLPILTER